MIHVDNLIKIFRDSHGDKVHALNGVSFRVPEGQFFTLLGPSGCGKTPLLRLIAGLENPQAGEIHIRGQLVCSADKKHFIPANERDIGMVFQSYAIWPHMSVFENVASLKSVNTLRLNEIKGELTALATVRLDGFRSALLHTSAVGQRAWPWRAPVREPVCCWMSLE
jgi:iron(III) transport system ATP-binding protein